jgi:prolipoprotein diacylglyceryltransferase
MKIDYTLFLMALVIIIIILFVIMYSIFQFIIEYIKDKIGDENTRLVRLIICALVFLLSIVMLPRFSDKFTLTVPTVKAIQIVTVLVLILNAVNFVKND